MGLKISVFVPTYRTQWIDLKGGLEKGESGRTSQILGVPPAITGLGGLWSANDTCCMIIIAFVEELLCVRNYAEWFANIILVNLVLNGMK